MGSEGYKGPHERPSSGGAPRLALRPPEAAEALGISERKLREMLPELPHIRRGGVLMIPIEPLRRWLEEQAQRGSPSTEAVVDDVLDSIGQ